MFSFLPHLALMLCYYKNNCSLQKELSLDISSKTSEVTGNEQKKTAGTWVSAAIEYFPTDRADFLLVAWWHGAAVSYTFSGRKKNSPPGRVPSTQLADFRSEVRNDNKTWVKQGTTQSYEQIQSLGTSLASIPGIGNVGVYHQQENSSRNKCHSSRALEVWDVLASWTATRSAWKRNLEKNLEGISVSHV